MELVIKIPDKVYNRIKSDNGHGYCTLRDQDERVIVNAVCNSIRLDKGHGDLIDRNALITELERDFHGTLTESGAHLFVGITSYIDDAETIVEADKENDNG